MWMKFDCQTIGDYHDLYLKTDVYLLADIFENFRVEAFRTYQLDPANYYTLPGFAWDALLMYSGVSLELLTDYDQHLFVESGMRGGVSIVSQRYAADNNHYQEKFDVDQPSTFIQYLDVNNLYGWAMSQHLPVSDFRWEKPSEKLLNKILNTQDDSGQVVGLSAGFTRQPSLPFRVTFGDGQPTADVTSYLPECVVGSSGGSGPFIRLEKTDGSLVLAEIGAFSGFTGVPVNITAHPILDTSYTGLYHCTRGTSNSTQTYQLNIVAQQVRSGSSPTSLTLPYSGVSYTIPCMSSGNFPLNASWNSTFTLDSQMIQTVTKTNMVNSMFSFWRNDAQIVFTESDTSGVTFNVICTTSYTTNFDCIGMGSNPPRQQNVIDRCVNAAQAISTTVSVTVQAQCPTLTDTKFNYKPISCFNTLPGNTVSIECRTGFLSNNSMEITQSICQGNGRWQPRQPVCESCILECNDTNVVNCNQVPAVGMAMATVNCVCGQNFQWTIGQCQLIPTDPATTTINSTPQSTTGSTPGSTTGSTPESSTTTSGMYNLK
ncbi:uncharacterized protein LOC135812954 [Sycon ciliatum]|uniref:uncharacterized protein LOC135812954 n=1 Tax=Sycon ciliatum TaxID=27933 RepID=UPI0031F61480